MRTNAASCMRLAPIFPDFATSDITEGTQNVSVTGCEPVVLLHKQLEAVLQAWSAEHDGTASQILPSEFQELSTLGPEDRLFLASLRSRVEEGMSYEHFEESVRLRLEPAPAALRDDESDLPQPRRTSFDDEQDSWLPLESQDIEDRKNDEGMDGL